MQIVLDAEPWHREPALVKMPWNYRSRNTLERIKIGIMYDDGTVTPHPPITRALKEIKKKLLHVKNIECVDWTPYQHAHAWQIISRLYYPDGGQEEESILAESGEPMLPLTKWIIAQSTGSELSVSQLQWWQEQRDTYREEYARHWDDTMADANGPVDVVLCPAAPGMAPPHGTAKYWNYTSQWNLLDYPAIVFPVTKADKNVDNIMRDYKPVRAEDEENWKLCEF